MYTLKINNVSYYVINVIILQIQNNRINYTRFKTFQNSNSLLVIKPIRIIFIIIETFRFALSEGNCGTIYSCRGISYMCNVGINVSESNSGVWVTKVVLYII